MSVCLFVINKQRLFVAREVRLRYHNAAILKFAWKREEEGNILAAHFIYGYMVSDIW